jgi:hypothetical protein
MTVHRLQTQARATAYPAHNPRRDAAYQGGLVGFLIGVASATLVFVVAMLSAPTY